MLGYSYEISNENDDEIREDNKNAESEIEIRREIHKRAVEEEYGGYKIQSIIKTDEGDLLVFSKTENKKDFQFLIPIKDLVKMHQMDTIENLS